MAAAAASTVAMVMKPKPRQGPMLLPMARASSTCLPGWPQQCFHSCLHCEDLFKARHNMSPLQETRQALEAADCCGHIASKIRS